LSRAPSHRSLFSIVASCDRWGGKTRSSSSRLLLSAVHPGALVRGQRPEKLPLIVACGLRIARLALFDHFLLSHSVRPTRRLLRSPHLKFDCCVGALVASRSTSTFHCQSS
jgi:hypothetical protein